MDNRAAFINICPVIGHDYDGFIGQLSYHQANGPFGFVINGEGEFIKDDYGRIPQEKPRHGNLLHRYTWEIIVRLPNAYIIILGKSSYQHIQAGLVRRQLYLFTVADRLLTRILS